MAQAVPLHEIRSQLETLCAHNAFAGRAVRQRELLRDLVAHSLSGKESDLVEGAIGARVFRRSPGYDTNADPIVRVTVGHLRERLAEYYAKDGRHDRVIIRIPSGGYRVQALFNASLPPDYLDDQAAQHVWIAEVGMGKRTPAGYALAFRHLALAMEQHPGHTRLLALKALAHLNNSVFQPQYPRIELEAAERLISSFRGQPTLPWEAWLADACIQQYLFWDWEKAMAAYETAIALSQGEAQYYQSWYPALLASQRRMFDAIRIVQRAVDHFAHDLPVMRGDLATLQLMAGQFRESELTINTTLAVFENDRNYAYLCLAMLHEARGNFAEAADTIQRIPVDSPEGLIVMGLRYAFIGFAGDTDAARKGYEQLIAARESTFVPATQVAMAALGSRDYRAAVRWLTEGAVAERDPVCIWYNVLPCLRHLRDDADFRTLVLNTMRLTFPDSA